MECPFTEEQIEWLRENLQLRVSHHSEMYSERGYYKLRLTLANEVLSEEYINL